MHSLPLQFIIAMMAHAINERMARRADYLQAENRTLKEALHVANGKTRIPLTNEQRRRLATMSAQSSTFQKPRRGWCA